MMREKARRPSPLQRRILIVLAALDAKRPGPVATRDIERLLAQGGEDAVYGNNLRASCRRMELAGWLRTLRAPNLQLAVELTPEGRAQALPLLADEQARVSAEQRAAEVCVLPLVRVNPADDAGVSGDDRPVRLDGVWQMVCRADFVVRLDGSTCVQLWNAAGQVRRHDGDPLQVAHWLQACHDAGIDVRVQVNESQTPDEGIPALKGAERPCDQASDMAEIWCQSLVTALSEDHGIAFRTKIALNEVPSPGRYERPLSVQERFLAVMDRLDSTRDAAYSDRFEEDVGPQLEDTLSAFGFTSDQAFRLRCRVRWPLMDEAELVRRDRVKLTALLDALAERGLFCDQESLLDGVFAAGQDETLPWFTRLEQVLSHETAGQYGFYSPASRQKSYALTYLSGYVGREAVEALDSVVAWKTPHPEKP
jgi:hypothetical protein